MRHAHDIVVHQLALSTTSLQTWTLSNIRTGLISQNKEGLVSLPGYLAIYILGLATGEHIIRSAKPVNAKQTADDASHHREKRRTELALELFSYGVAWWAALAVWTLWGGEVSRRLVSYDFLPCQSRDETEQSDGYFYWIAEIPIPRRICLTLSGSRLTIPRSSSYIYSSRPFWPQSPSAHSYSM